MTGLILVRDPHTGAVLHHAAAEPQPFAQVEAHVAALLDTVRQQAADLTRLRRLVLEVASAGIEYSARDYVVLQLPTVTWDALEEEASRG